MPNCSSLRGCTNVTADVCLCQTDSINPYHNLALEQYLLQHVAPGQIILYLWRNQRTVVIGINQNVHKECDLEAMEMDHCYLARRSSGGGAVYHDLGNLNYSFIGGSEIYDVNRQQNVIIAALQGLGLPVKVNGRNDLEIASRKISGNAYQNGKDGSVHHGTLLYNTDMKMMSRYLNVSPVKIQAKGVDSIRSRVANLVDFDFDLTLDQLKRALSSAFAAEYGPVTKISEPDDLDDLIEHYHSYKYLYNRISRYSLIVHDYFSFGEAQLYFDVQNNKILKADIYTDALDVDLADKIKAVFNDLPIDQNIFVQRMAEMNRPELIADLTAIFRQVRVQLL